MVPLGYLRRHVYISGVILRDTCIALEVPMGYSLGHHSCHSITHAGASTATMVFTYEKAFPASRMAARRLGNLPNLWSFLDSTLLCSPGGMGPCFTI